MSDTTKQSESTERSGQAPFAAPDGSTFVVTAYRWGLRDAHSYVVGAYPTLATAMSAANAHLDYRGGKYGVEVMECSGTEDDSGVNAKGQAAYIESPYFGLAGQNRPACQPADKDKHGFIKDGVFLVKAEVQPNAAGEPLPPTATTNETETL